MEFVHEAELAEGHATKSSTTAVIALGVFLMLVYAITSSPDLPASIDTQTNALSAHTLAKTGSPFIPQYESIVAVPETAGNATWVVESPRGPVAQYPPGTAILATPLYLLADDELNVIRELSPPYPDGTAPLVLPDMWPGAVTAVVVSAGAMVLLGLTLSEIGMNRRIVTGTMIAVGLGTGVWSVAADSLWQHGPAILCIGLAARGLARPGSARLSAHPTRRTNGAQAFPRQNVRSSSDPASRVRSPGLRHAGSHERLLRR